MKEVAYIVFLFFFLCQSSLGQKLSNLRGKNIFCSNDTIKIDTLSIVPNSVSLYLEGTPLRESDFKIDYPKSLLIIEDKKLLGRLVKIQYGVYPIAFTQEYAHKKKSIVKADDVQNKDPFSFEYTVKNEDVFYLNGLNKSGSISRGVSFGNNQDLSVNSNLNLQLSGKVNNGINILASISDDNIPIQVGGNTQQLQDFDRVYIQLYDAKWKLIAGDFFLKQPESYFMRFNKKVQGGSFRTQLNSKKGTHTPTISVAASRGKFSRNSIQGVEGNQGPYRLSGSENETFIIVLSGTERVYIDGKLMKRGNAFDYIIDYNTAEVVFTTNRLITKDSRIVVEFQYSDRNYARSLLHAGNTYERRKLKLGVDVFSERDSKNQPLLYDLSDDQKVLLGNIGDSLQEAVVSNLTTVEFSENLVLYKMVDSLGYDSVFVYSVDPDSAKYQLGFSFLGENMGNYNQVRSTANGKVYEWVAPVMGVPQGSYEPVILLVTPKTTQMAIFNGEYVLSDNSKLMWEGGVSYYDKNTFSNLDKKDDIGYVFKINSINRRSFFPKVGRNGRLVLMPVMSILIGILSRLKGSVLWSFREIGTLTPK